MKKLFFIFFLILYVHSLNAQNYSWFFITASSENLNPSFKRVENLLVYTGNNQKLKNIFKKYKVSEFKKTYRNAKKENLNKTFFVVCNSDLLLTDLLKETNHLFEFGKIIPEEDKKIYEPNDYGLTSTIGENKGAPANLDYLDFLGLPKAWYYTTGNKETIIGLSDGQVNILNKDFRTKTKVLTKSTLSGGHGSSVASILASRGNNSYGVPGVCFDCSLATSKYGDFKTLKHITQLANEKLNIINCSWAGMQYKESAQTIINQLYNKGVLVVAASGNANWNVTKGKRLYYPASFDHVISVAAGMYKYENVQDNILYLENGIPYAANIRGYVGRTMGFKDKINKKNPYIFSVSITTLNPKVDILAPSTGVFHFNKFILENELSYDINEHTSNAAPFVTGTIALMLSLNPCLPIDEVESILKITATNIDHIEANKPYYGNYGAGMLNTGKAVEMVYKLYTPTETSFIENQIFRRWSFKITSLSKQTIIKNQKILDSASLKLSAKNKIIIKKNTILKPNKEGQIHLQIDSNLKKGCNLVLRKGFPNNKYYFPKEKKNSEASLTPY
ncbi:MAG: S8 family peptidase [Flavobacteriales bacterium]